MGESVYSTDDSDMGPLPQDCRVLIVDDERAICSELEKFFSSIGMNSFSVNSPDDVLDALQQSPDLVILDIWMPGKDGLEVLADILSQDAAPPVMMMSGHATISTAVKATQMGACDFIEKPLDLEVLQDKVAKALGVEIDPEAGEQLSISEQTKPAIVEIVGSKEEKLEASGEESITPRKDVFGSQPFMGRKIVQRTLRHATILYGQGLHSGKKSGISLEPLPENSGIHFVGVSADAAVPAHVDYVQSTGFATSLKRGATEVSTIEHLLSALHAYGVSNLLIKCNEEVPVFDGSALDFCSSIEEVGLVEQPGEWYALKVTEPISVDTQGEQITITPADEFQIDYTLQYPEPLGTQHYVFTLSDVEAYKREIASARTFGFVKDVGYLQAQGLAQGGRFDNFILYGKDGALNQELRFPDEAVRHKILDVIGDLYLLGRPLQGRVKAVMTGHSDNVALLKAIQQAFRS